MKYFKTLLFILFVLKLNGQSEKTSLSNGLLESLNVNGDIHLAIGGTEYKGNGTKMFSSQISLSARFKNHFYASLSLVNTKEITIDLFGLMTVPDKVVKLSLVGGGHFTVDFCYLALGAGLSRQTGQYWDFTANSKKTIQNFGLDFKSQVSFIVADFMAIGFSHNYNFNNSRNYQSLMIGLQFGHLR